MMKVMPVIAVAAAVGFGVYMVNIDQTAEAN